MAAARLFATDAVALREERVGRGYGVTLCDVFDLALVGKNGASYHALTTSGKPLCGVRGEPYAIEIGVDARAERVKNRPVCVNCRDLLGPVTAPRAPEDA
jgi:hypothetical protein